MRRIALIAHDGKKQELLELVGCYLDVLSESEIVATGTTGGLVGDAFGLQVERVESGPRGGDLQVGARVASGEVDLVVFLRDPLAAHPHEPDIQALMKVCDVHKVPLATNTTTAALCLNALTVRWRSADGLCCAASDGLNTDWTIKYRVGDRYTPSTATILASSIARRSAP